MGTPVILCGKTEAIGVGVIANLKPEYEGMSHSFATMKISPSAVMLIPS